MSPACLSLLILSILRPLPPAAAASPAGFTEAPAYVALFTPRGAPPGAYRAYVSSHDLDRVLAGLRRDTVSFNAPGSFEAESVIAADAFGQSGAYNRWKLALLYGARRARVARGPRIENGRVVEAWTLISPYPDRRLERLQPGTLLIVLTPQS